MPATDPPGSPSIWADSVLSNMSLDEKIGQLFMIAAYSNLDKGYNSELINTVKKYHIGGVCFFQGGPARQAALTNRLQQNSSIPLLIGMDAEWGAGISMDSVPILPQTLTLGALEDDNLVYNEASLVAQQLKLLGVQVNFAPVSNKISDHSNPANINHSFGENIELVTKKASAFMHGLQDNGIIAVAKYFPDFGDTGGDSDDSLLITDNAVQAPDSVDLFPFRKLISEGIDGIMVGHRKVPSPDNGPIPASLSDPIIDNLLKEELGFRGIVFSDKMNKKEVADLYHPGEAEALAFIAGVDVILLPGNLEASVNEIKKAIQARKIKKSELNDHVRKLLLLKKRFRLWNNPPVDVKKSRSVSLEESSRVLIQTIYEQTLTQFINKDGFIPVRSLDTIKFASLSVDAGEYDQFQNTLGNYAPFMHFTLNQDQFTPEKYSDMADHLKEFNSIVIGYHPHNPNNFKDFGIEKDLLLFLQVLSRNSRIIVVVFGNSNIAKYFPGFQNVICTYEDNSYTQMVAPQAIFGAIGIKGKSPVTITHICKNGDGIETKDIGRLGYTFPEREGFDLNYLKYIDTIAIDAIRTKATPGCRVLVAKNGKVVLDRSYGYFTYDSLKLVDPSSVYDLASVTKVAATLLVIMMLEERHLIDLDKKISRYLPELRNSNKEDLTIRDILTHQSGIRSYIAFWKITTRTPVERRRYYSKTRGVAFPVEIAPGLYGSKFLADSIWSWIIKSPLRKTKNTLDPFNYRYSDIGIFVLHHMVERLLNQPMPEFLSQNIYGPLGLSTLTYLPLETIPKERIVPSAIDDYFRNDTLIGYVQDELAAQNGGVAGHAGLFSNANDLAIIMQMMLQNGYYGGQRYFKPGTINNFAKQQYRLNWRGLGWDKPNYADEKASHASGYASSSSFGHTGFTGTMIWADPEQNLVYIFLSNRTYPRSYNNKLNEQKVRKRIQTVIYSALIKH